MLPLLIKNLSLTVNRQRLLNDIDLNITGTGISVIMGHNGAGKSLLLRCMHGLLTPATGAITWDGLSAFEISTRKKQAMVFQKPLMLNRSVAENINYVLKLRGKNTEQCSELLSRAGLADKHTQPARSLSGGEQQRLAIARALATEPEVLFLDEPTANLDPSATLKIESQIITASQHSVKVILVTHDIAQARRLADEVVFIHNGSIAEHTIANSFFLQPESVEARNYLSSYTGALPDTVIRHAEQT